MWLRSWAESPSQRKPSGARPSWNLTRGPDLRGWRSGLTADAKKESVRDGVPPIELVDGEKLVNLLEELEIGLVPVTAYQVDEAFFGSFGKAIGEEGRG